MILLKCALSLHLSVCLAHPLCSLFFNPLQSRCARVRERQWEKSDICLTKSLVEATPLIHSEIQSVHFHLVIRHLRCLPSSLHLCDLSVCVCGCECWVRLGWKRKKSLQTMACIFAPVVAEHISYKARVSQGLPLCVIHSAKNIKTHSNHLLALFFQPELCTQFKCINLNS